MDIKLTSQEIYDKEFKKKKIGPAYDEDEVNDFLNIIIEDYENFERSIDDLKQQIEELRRENYKAKSNFMKSETTSYPVNRSVEDRLSTLEENIDLILQKIK